MGDKLSGDMVNTFSEGRDPGDGLVMFVKAPKKRVVVDDVPEAIFDLFEANVFVIECLAEKVLPGVQAEGACPIRRGFS
jgi:hypothetical protein